MNETAKRYDPKAIEHKWYAYWIEHGCFHADAEAGGEPYAIVIPPPNVTGILHMGHALNNTIQDVLIRWRRMQGRNVVWVPGTDHASIATEQKVVALLEEQGVPKDSLTREKFLEHAWEWKEKYGGIIINQLKKLGCSCDWDRERFTMDEEYTRAVLEAFVRLYDKGIIHRGHRLVNWCPKSQSAISDEEVEHREVQGKLWHFRYPIVDSDEYIVVATTRPETMLGDTAVAINPDDQRYRHLIGRKILLPLVHREMPIITDDHVDPEFGTGCVKVTPAHDPNDFAMGERHELKFINIMNADASLNQHVPEAYQGLTREAARKKVVADMEEQGLLEKIEEHMHKVGYSQRGGVPIEFYMSEQWFMHMKKLAKPALEAVQDGTVRITPEHWVKTYQHWMDNIQDWCISRQLWWGHRIPVWYRKGADRNDPAERHVSIDGPPDPENWEQDEDVLDTWASSWLWPFAVHSWPEDSQDLAKYYPTAVLATGPDILFFWVARMVMAGIEFMGEAPFSDVYLHGIVRDGQGRKMSKSLGNSLDPIEIIEKYSADALRFSLIMLTATGQDVYVSDEKFELGRNFGTKIWNAVRFIQMHMGNNPGLVELEDGVPVCPSEGLSDDDRHLLTRLNMAVKEAEANLEAFRFNDYAKTIYEFIWHQLCDRYLEYAKQDLGGDDEQRRHTVLNILNHTLHQSIRLLHPLMPFLTEELWERLAFNAVQESIMKAPWPAAGGVSEEDRVSARFVDQRYELTSAARTLKADYKIDPARRLAYFIKPVDEGAEARLLASRAALEAAVLASELTVDASFVPDSAMPSVLTPLGNVYMSLEGAVDVEKERARLDEQRAELEKHLKNTQAKLANSNFVDRAPADVVQVQRDREEELVGKLAKLDEMAKTFAAMDA